MSALKRPGIWDKKATPVIQGEEELSTQLENYKYNQKIEITAESLGDQDTNSLGDEDPGCLNSEDSLLQNVQDSNSLGGQKSDRLDVQEVKQQSSQKAESLDRKAPKRQKGQTSKRQDAENLDIKDPDILDAKPLGNQMPSQLEDKPHNAEPSGLHVDQTPKPLSDDVAKPLDGETPKKKKAKSASLVKKTYYIDPDLDGAIELMAVLQKGDQSDIVRQLLRSVIPEYYLTQWKAMRDHSR